MATKKKKGLGKGLDALFADVAPAVETPSEPAEVSTAVNGESVVSIGIDEVKPNSTQPRKTFDPAALEDLTASILEHGIIQPILVRPSGKGYEIVAGERRYRAAREAGLKEIPCIIRELSDQENMLLAIVENMQREDLNPIEEAEGLHAMIDTYAMTQEQVSKSVGKSRPYIANAIRLLGLPEEVLKMVRDGALSAGHGRTLLSVSDEAKQIALAKRCLKEGLSVRALEDIVNQKPGATKKKPRPRAKDPNVAAIEDELKSLLGTKVQLTPREGRKAGKLEISFYSDDELERLLEYLRG